MTPTNVLHNAARRYCIDEHAERWDRYQQLVAAHGERLTTRSGSWEYSDAAFDLFPRYQVLEAIRTEVERLVPAEFESVEALRFMLEAAGETANDQFTKFEHPVARRAADDERRRFVEFVRTADIEKLSHLPRLPFRRVLLPAEHGRLDQAFARRWGRWGGGYREDGDQPADVVTLHVDAMEAPGAYDAIRSALASRGIERVVELREWGDGLELETAAAEFTYNGGEGFWTAGDMDWMVYASHEASISFGGDWLVDVMRAHLPQFDRYLYRGWDSALYE